MNTNLIKEFIVLLIYVVRTVLSLNRLGYLLFNHGSEAVGGLWDISFMSVLAIAVQVQRSYC